MEFGVLGPLQVTDGGREIEIPAGRQRSLLAALLLRANQVVATDQLVAQLWDDQPPRDARATAQTYIRRLRVTLGCSRIETAPGGYVIAVEPDRLDLTRFDELVRQARESGDPDRQAGLLARALRLWRGPALANVPSEALQRSEVPALAERRLWALERRVELDLVAGRHGEVVGELRALVTAHPFRERFWAQLMTALAGGGAQAEALQAYQDLRTRLADEFGADPGPELQELHRAILRGELPGRLPAPAPEPRSACDPAPAGSQPDGEPAPDGPPAQLPPDVPGFTGRATELTDLDRLRDAARRGSTVALVAITGTGGVGKTTLAVHWAHQTRGHFPDGQLYLNLHGYATPDPHRTGSDGSSGPLHPAQALAGFLRALGTPPDRVPTDPAEAAARYRSLLADRQMLILLDNAAHPDQIRPLLPAGPGNLVLVTSRNQLGGLVARDGAHRLALAPLPPADAQTLLAELLGTDRVHAEPAAATALGRLCGHLPLALRIAAANLIGQPRRRLEDYLTELRDRDRLAGLAVPGDEQSAIRATFDLSYHRLADRPRQLFRWLGLAPGVDFTAESAAALAGTPPEPAREALAALVDAHLLERPASDRYAFHDLLRVYAADRARREDPEPDRAAALRRLYRYRLGTAGRAAALLHPQMLRLPMPAEPDREGRLPQSPPADQAEAPADRTPAPADQAETLTDRSPAPADTLPDRTPALADQAETPTDRTPAPADQAETPADRSPAPADTLPDRTPALADRAEALAWVDAERANLVATISHTARHGPPEVAWRLTDALRGYFLWGAPTVDWRAAAEAALAAGEAAGDERAQAAAHWSLAGLGWRQNDYPRAIAHGERALALTRQAGWVAGQAAALGNLGTLYSESGQLAAAIIHLDEAVTVCEQAGRPATPTVFSNLGLAYLQAGELTRAAGYAERAFARNRELGSSNLEASTLTVLGEVHHAQGRLDPAQDRLTRALASARSVGNRIYEGEILSSLAAVHRDAGQHRQAFELAHRALAVAGAVGHPGIEIEALHTLGTLLHQTGAEPAAVERFQQAANLAVAAADPYPQARALIDLASAHHHLGRLERARAHLQQALELAQAQGFRMVEGRALTALADLSLDTGEPEPALAHAAAAMAIHQRTGHRLGQARTHLVLGRIRRALGDPAAADDHWRRADRIFTAVGSPEADRVRALRDGRLAPAAGR